MSENSGALVHEPNADGPVPGENPDQPYLTPEAVRSWIKSKSAHELDQLWRSHNVKAEWVPTIKYPPGFADKVSAAARSTLLQRAFVDDLVNWITSCRKVWSISSAARFVVRMAYADALRRLVSPVKQPPTKPAAQSPAKPEVKA